MKIGYLAAILKRYKYFFSWNMVVISVYTYGVKIIKQSGGKVVFSGEFHGTLRYELTEVRGTLYS